VIEPSFAATLLEGTVHNTKFETGDNGIRPDSRRKYLELRIDPEAFAYGRLSGEVDILDRSG